MPTPLVTRALPTVWLSELLNAFNKGYGQDRDAWDDIQAAIPWSFGDSQHTLIDRETFCKDMIGYLGCTEDDFDTLVPKGCFIDLEN